MNIQSALKSQYHGALAMVKQAIEICPDEVWTGTAYPTTTPWVAYHALFFSHFYLQPNEAAFQRWEKHRAGSEADSYTRAEMLEYWAMCDGMIDEGIDRLNLDAPECGFPWYDMPKLDHQIMNIRHIQEHAGQLAERLRHAGVEMDWVG